MLKKFTTLFLMLIVASSFTFAQNLQVLKANGDIIPVSKKFLDKSDATINSSASKLRFDSVQGTIDTIDIATDFGIELAGNNFVFYGQDVEMQWFEAPADLTIKAAGANFQTSDLEGNTMGIRLMKLNWTKEQLLEVVADGARYIGYYPFDGDGANGTEPFGEENGTPWFDGTEGAYPIPPWTDNADPAANTFEYDLWSDGTFTWDEEPILQEVRGASYHFVSMENLAFEPTVLAGEIFAVVIVNNGTTGWSASDDGITTTYGTSPTGYSGWKYYEGGRLAADQPGWWAREYAWNFAVVVDLTGDRAPVIGAPTQIATSVNVGPFNIEVEITDDNPSGGEAGVGSALLQWSIDDGATWTDETMTAAGDIYSGQIPEQAPGSEIVYQIYAEDVGGLSTTRPGGSFAVFEATAPTLLVFNGFSSPSGYPQSYYFGIDDFADYNTFDFEHDSWAYGPVDAALLNFYVNVIEITINNSGPSVINSDVIAEWLAGSGDRNYMLVGDEWNGVQSGWVNGPHEAGSFHFDVLGMTYEYNDFNPYDVDVAIPTLVAPVEGSALGGALFTLFASQPTDSMLYDPVYELGAGTGANYIDGADLTEDCEVDMHGYAADGTEYNIGWHRTLPAGNKIAVLFYDALSVNSSPEYYWYGFSESAPQVEALKWFGNLTDVRKTADNIPSRHSLGQNYPNPFNPSTTIDFAINKSGLTSLKIYNILGQEVATLVNKNLTAGEYSVNFDASELTSGMYIYTIQNGDVEISKKMMLLK